MPRKLPTKSAISKASLSAQLTALAAALVSSTDELRLIKGILLNAQLTFRAAPGRHTDAEWKAATEELEALRVANGLLSRRLEETFAIRGQEDKSGAYTTSGVLPGYQNRAMAVGREEDLLLDVKDLRAHNRADEVTLPDVQHPQRYNDFIVCQSLPVEQAKGEKRVS